jgi:hypothetical protein
VRIVGGLSRETQTLRRILPISLNRFRHPSRTSIGDFEVDNARHGKAFPARGRWNSRLPAGVFVPPCRTLAHIGNSPRNA